MLNEIKSDFWFAFFSSPVTVFSTILIFVLTFGFAGAEIFAPHTPFDPFTISILDNHLPPAWLEGGDRRFLLGTDIQGRDVFSAIFYGGRISIIVGLGAVLLSTLIGVTAGLLAGFLGGWADNLIMRFAEIQFSFPPILIALLFNGILRTVLPADVFSRSAIPILILAIGLSGWVQYARIVRASTLIERNKDYISACDSIGLPTRIILFRHLLPNILGPVLVIAMLHFAVAIVTEATLSFLGLGTPLTQPSLGALIQDGSNYLFSGKWWVVIFPGLTLVIFVICLNLVADWFRDYLNPKLR